MVKERKAGIIGVYGKGPEFTTGQAVKCFELISWLQDRYGPEQIMVVNTWRWKRNPIRLMVRSAEAFLFCKNVLMLPAQNGIRVFAPLCFLGKKLTGKPVHYVVIGGWLGDFLRQHPFMKRLVAAFDGVYVETKAMVDQLEELGLTNTVYLPNFRKTSKEKPVAEVLPFQSNAPLKVCTYSRVVKEKGIEDGIRIVRRANEKLGHMAFRLDIYGKIAREYEGEFQKILETNQDLVEYKGVKEADQGAETLKGYFALLFPTYYAGEGFAGTVLDAFAAATPVIVNDWKYIREMVWNGENGFIYPFRDVDAAAALLCKLKEDDSLYRRLREGCIRSAEMYRPEAVLSKLDRRMR